MISRETILYANHIQKLRNPRRLRHVSRTPNLRETLWHNVHNIRKHCGLVHTKNDTCEKNRTRCGIDCTIFREWQRKRVLQDARGFSTFPAPPCSSLLPLGISSPLPEFLARFFFLCVILAFCSCSFFFRFCSSGIFLGQLFLLPEEALGNLLKRFIMRVAEPSRMAICFWGFLLWKLTNCLFFRGRNFWENSRVYTNLSPVHILIDASNDAIRFLVRFVGFPSKCTVSGDHSSGSFVSWSSRRVLVTFPVSLQRRSTWRHVSPSAHGSLTKFQCFNVQRSLISFRLNSQRMEEGAVVGGRGRGEEWCPHSTSSRIIKVRGC